MFRFNFYQQSAFGLNKIFLWVCFVIVFLFGLDFFVLFWFLGFLLRGRGSGDGVVF